MNDMDLALLIDFGSTFTKIQAIDLEAEEIVAYAQSCTTVETDIMVGLRGALDLLPARVRNSAFSCKLSSSSAAGGLGMVTFRLSAKELQELESLHPDILLLAGGTDGGNADVILENAKKLALSRVHCPIVIAGNKAAADEVNAILSASGKPTLVTDNVMPEVNVLNVEPAREMIRRASSCLRPRRS
jgi:hypothetical protein